MKLRITFVVLIFSAISCFAMNFPAVANAPEGGQAGTAVVNLSLEETSTSVTDVVATTPPPPPDPSFLQSRAHQAWAKITDTASTAQLKVGELVAMLKDGEKAVNFADGLEKWVPGGASTIFLARGAQVLGQDSCAKGFELCGAIAFGLSFLVVLYQTMHAGRFAIGDMSTASTGGPANREKVWKLIVPPFTNVCSTMIWLQSSCSKDWEFDSETKCILVLLSVTYLFYIRLAHRWMWPN